MLTLIVQLKERVIHYPLTDNYAEIRAGSLPESQIYLPYKGISRQHFSLKKTDSAWKLRDLGSTNGTLLNGERIKEAIIQEGDVIQVGTVQLRIEKCAKESEPFPIKAVSEKVDSLKTDQVTPIDVNEGPLILQKLRLPEGAFYGKSAAMAEIYGKIHAILESDVNVLFIGETGTGKEILARTMHLSSSRANAPFVAVNCAAIPADLIEAELFGIGERVATNVSQRKGKIVAASGGTLFLDEVEAFPFGMQAKILRVLEERTVTPVGEHRAQPVNFRLLSATNEEPDELIQTQKLRGDLYHRLSTVEIHVPPLRERKEDLEVLIPGLFDHFAKKENKNFGGISNRLMEMLLNYSYPGNLRELTNVIRAAVALAYPGELLDVHLVPERMLSGGVSTERLDEIQEMLQAGKVPLKKVVDEYTRNLIMQTLRLHDGNIRRAAEHLDITPFGLRKMINRLKITG